QMAQRQITNALIDRTPVAADQSGRDWMRAHPYVRAHLSTHAAAAGRLDELIIDEQYLLAAVPDQLLAVLPIARNQLARTAARAYRLAAHYLRTKSADERAE